MITITPPSDAEIDQTIEIIQKKLASCKLSENVQHGYEEAVRILKERIDSYSRISPTLKAGQPTAIAVLAVDYLAGEFTQKVMVGIEKQEGEEY